MARRRRRALTAPGAAGEHWLACITGGAAPVPPSPLVGILRGDGVGPEITDAALLVLRRLVEVGGTPIRIELAGEGGDAVAFCRDVLDRGGAVLAGPTEDDLRAPLGVALSLTPIDARTALPSVAPLRADVLAGVDALVVRAAATVRPRAALDAAARLAARRRGALSVVDGNSAWRAAAAEAATAHGVSSVVAGLGATASRLVAAPRDFDVIVAPPDAGDVLADLGGVLAGARSIAFRGDFTLAGAGVYRPGHGPAHRLAATDRANPGGQLLALAMLLRVSLGLRREAAAVEIALRRAWRDGHRTLDVAERDSRLVGTAELGALVAGGAGAHLAGARVT